MTRPNSRRGPSERYHDGAFLNALASVACDRIEDVLTALSVKLSPSGRCLEGPCPVHGGDSPTAFRLYPDGFEARGNWSCNSRKCHRHFPRTLAGFVRGVLSHDLYGWCEPGDRQATHAEAVRFVLRSLGLKAADIKPDAGAAQAARLAREVSLLTLKPEAVQTALCTRDQLHAKLKIPSPYFLGRGFRPETLVRFEVGEVIDPRSPHFGRSLYPVYDATGTLIVGGVSRSHHPKCEGCGFCHASGPCPEITRPADRLKYVRWRLAGKWVDKHHLYNLATAKPYVTATRSVVVVESAGDVWRLHEAGVKHAVGLFGSSLDDLQVNALLALAVRRIVVLTDPNAAGDEAAAEIKRRCLFANVTRIRPPHEVGDMPADEVRGLLGG